MILVIGIFLMTYMIIVESEPGDLPLLIVIGSILGLVYTETQIRSYTGKM